MEATTIEIIRDEGETNEIESSSTTTQIVPLYSSTDDGPETRQNCCSDNAITNDDDKMRSVVNADEDKNIISLPSSSSSFENSQDAEKKPENETSSLFLEKIKKLVIDEKNEANLNSTWFQVYDRLLNLILDTFKPRKFRLYLNISLI